MRLAWFSPLPPTRSGIAAYSAEVLPRLRARGLAIDTFTEQNAHEFVWRQRRQPYDLHVFQLGNAQCHDYMWAYLFRYPGLVALHDAQLHQARALFLTKRWAPRIDDYKAEVWANHPDAPPDLPYLVLARMADRMYQHWPMVKLVVESARMTLVHSEWVAEDLRSKYPAANIRAIAMGTGDSGFRLQAPGLRLQAPGSRPQASESKPQASGSALQASGPRLQASGPRLQASGPRLQASGPREAHGIPADAVVVAAFGGVTPEKRIPQLLRAAGAIGERHPHVHVLLVGDLSEHYDARADAEAAGISDRVHVSGYVPDEQLADYLHAADICACLRWPTNRETSASWLRCLGAARPTIITGLMHLGDVPALDPRGWRVQSASNEAAAPVAVSIDPLDEDQSLQLALERLVVDAALRARLGEAARAWWLAHHQLDAMAAAYVHVIEATLASRPPSPMLPAHLTADGTDQLRSLTGELGIVDRLRDLL